MNRFLSHNNEVVIRDLFSKIPQKKTLQIKSIQVHISLKDQKFDAENFLLPAILGIEMITGQKPQLHFCRRPLASLNLREGDISGLSTRLRGKAALAFLENLVNTVLPTLRPFEGLSIKSLDSQGNLTFQIPDLVSFPEIEQEYLHFQQGARKNLSDGGQKFLPVDITITSNCQSLEEGRLLLTAFQVPLVDLEGLTRIA